VFSKIYNEKQVSVSMGKSIQSFALALNGAPASERWDWSPQISRFLDRMQSFQKKK